MSDLDPLDAQRHLWTIGDYGAVARRLLPVSVSLLDALDLAPGARVLDVGTGDGNTALEAARRGAEVVGVDLTPAQLELARARVAAKGAAVELHEADAQSLPFPDGAFDAVVSVFGVIFAPDHVAALGEMARTCRPGGAVALAAWAEGGWMGAWRQRAAHLLPPSPGAGEPAPPSSDLWGDPAEAERRFRAAGLDVEVQARTLAWSFPSAEDAAAFFLATSGPFIAFHQAASAAGRGEEATAQLVQALRDTAEGDEGTYRFPSSYLLVLGRLPG